MIQFYRSLPLPTTCPHDPAGAKAVLPDGTPCCWWCALAAFFDNAADSAHDGAGGAHVIIPVPRPRPPHPSEVWAREARAKAKARILGGAFSYDPTARHENGLLGTYRGAEGAGAIIPVPGPRRPYPGELRSRWGRMRARAAALWAARLP